MHFSTFSHKCVSILSRAAALVLAASISLSASVVPVFAGHVLEEVTSSPLDANWPAGPSVTSETAILIEADTGTILYAKDAHKKMYPASITKILTTLIASEVSDLDENVTFSQEALDTIPYDSSRIWVDAGEYMSMEDCLAAILIVSANDVAAGVAEHIGGTLDNFADMMNERAEELGCLNSNFVNAHGYHDENHYTTAYDMSQIARAFFDNDLLCAFSRERSFKVEPSAGQPDSIWEFNKNQLLETRAYEYEYLVGSKTGYTSAAGQTLVSCAQKDGMKLICVVMNAQSPNQFKDTVTLFDFGFSNFTTANIYENDKTYVSADSSYGIDVIDVLGDSSPLLNMDRNSKIVLPKDASFADTTSYITMATEEENCMATAHYQYGSYDVGTAQIYVSSADSTLDESGSLEQEKTSSDSLLPETSVIYVNIKKIALVLIPSVLVAVLLLGSYRLFNAHRFAQNPKLTKKRLGHRLTGLKNLFVGFAQGVQALGYYFSNCIRSVAMRNRYKKRNGNYSGKRRSSYGDYDLKSGRSTSREYYSKSADLKSKDIVFHDLKK